MPSSEDDVYVAPTAEDSLAAPASAATTRLLPAPATKPYQPYQPYGSPTGLKRGIAWSDILMFRTFVTPSLILILFWVGVAIGVVAFLMSVAGAIDAGQHVGRGGQAGLIVFFGGLVFLAAWILFVRVMCELLIVFFRLYDEMRDLNRHLREKNKNSRNTLP